MSARIRTLEGLKAAALLAATALTSSAESENRDLRDDEIEALNKHLAEAKASEKQITALRTAQLATAGLRTTDDGRAVDIGAGRIVTRENKDDDARGGFASKADFFAAVRRSSIPGNSRDERLVFEAAAPGTFSNESSGVDGGFLVPPEFSKEIFDLSLTDDNLLAVVDVNPVAGNSMVFPKDETTPWGTDGVRAYWQAEASAGTATKVKLGESVMRLHKLMALAPVSDELAADGQALAGYLPKAMARSIRWKMNEAFLNGTGAGQPLGMFATGGPSVTVSKDSGQTANTVTIGNVSNMLAQLLGDMNGAFWMFGKAAIPSLLQLTIGNVPAFLPVSSPFTQKPAWMLLGLPCVISQHAPAFSSLGDLRLIDGSYYRALTKAGSGIETATSMHLYFDAGATAFRSTFRVDGQPKLAAAVSQAKDTPKLSPFVQLQNR
jgi:HK97 family phage major capsid protein